MTKVRFIAKVGAPNAQSNIALCQLARGKELFFIDLDEHPLNRDGELLRDLDIHPDVGDEFWIDQWFLSEVTPHALAAAFDSHEMRR